MHRNLYSGFVHSSFRALWVLVISSLIMFATSVASASGPPAPVTVSATGSEWGSTGFAADQTGNFTAEVDATPLAASIDGGIGLSDGPQTVFTGLACIARFNSSGFIDARNGGSYTAAASIPYTANQIYHFRFVVSVSTHTYSVYVTPPGQAEEPVGLNYAFRTEQQPVPLLNTWSIFADISSMQAANFLSASATATNDSVWTNSSFANQTGTFQAEWDAMPMASGMDGVMAISNGAQTSFTNFACLVRFFTDGTIQVRNGGVYAADTTITYSPDVMYHFRVPINLASHTYSVFVTASGGSEQTVATNYAFRIEQAGATALNNIGIIVDTTTGALRFGNFSATASTSAYNATVLADHPVAFWNLNAQGSTETDLTGNGNTGTYQGGTPGVSTMPDGEQAALFNGSSQYLTVPSNASFSVPTMHNLTWEIWIQPSVLQFPNASADAYVDVMGKCANYSPTCEWESRMYSTTTPQGRCNRMSAYVFNPTAGEGSGADWQPVCGLIQAGEWLHIVGEYTTLSQPSNCTNTGTYPGSINIWVNGVLWDQAAHAPTGCMSQFQVIPRGNNSPLNIGTMALDTWFDGAIAKVAIYNYLLSQTQITNHYQTMSGKQPTGSCGATCTF